MLDSTVGETVSAYWERNGVLSDYVANEQTNRLTNELHGAESFLGSAQALILSCNFRIYRNPKVHYRIHKSPQLVPSVIEINPVHALASMRRSSRWSLSFRCTNQNPIWTLISPGSGTCRARLIPLDLFTRVHIMHLLIMQMSSHLLLPTPS